MFFVINYLNLCMNYFSFLTSFTLRLDSLSLQFNIMAKEKYIEIKKFLIENADSIQKLATQNHKKFLGGSKFRSEVIKKYQANHIKIVREFAKDSLYKDIKKHLVTFKKI